MSAAEPEKPNLLSGGNPQIPKGEGDAPVQAYIAAMPGWKRDLGEHIDRRISEVVPDVQKAVKGNQPFYGTEPDSWFLTYRCFTHDVKSTFFRGTSLDTTPPESSRHPEQRHLGIREHDTSTTID